MDSIYVIGTAPTPEGYVSLGRSWERPDRILAFVSIEAALFAAAAGQVCIPGYFAGEQSPAPLSSRPTEEVVEALRAASLGLHIELEVWDGEFEPYATGTNLWVERLSAAQAAALRHIFDRHADPAIVGRPTIYRIPLEG